jgi:hypothetical protein
MGCHAEFLGDRWSDNTILLYLACLFHDIHAVSYPWKDHGWRVTAFPTFPRGLFHIGVSVCGFSFLFSLSNEYMIGCLLWHWYLHDVRSFAWYIMLHFEAARLLFNLQRNVLNFRKRYQLHLKCIQWLLSTMHVLLCRYHLQWECQRSCCVSITRDHVQDLFQNGSRYVIDLLALTECSPRIRVKHF